MLTITELEHCAQAVTMIIISFFNDVSYIIVDLSVTQQFEYLFTASLKNEPIFNQFFKKGTLGKSLVPFPPFTTKSLESRTFEIAENPAIAEKMQLIELSAIAGFYCTLTRINV